MRSIPCSSYLANTSFAFSTGVPGYVCTYFMLICKKLQLRGLSRTTKKWRIGLILEVAMARQWAFPTHNCIARVTDAQKIPDCPFVKLQPFVMWSNLWIWEAFPSFMEHGMLLNVPQKTDVTSVIPKVKLTLEYWTPVYRPWGLTVRGAHTDSVVSWSGAFAYLASRHTSEQKKPQSATLNIKKVNGCQLKLTLFQVRSSKNSLVVWDYFDFSDKKLHLWGYQAFIGMWASEY